MARCAHEACLFSRSGGLPPKLEHNKNQNLQRAIVRAHNAALQTQRQLMLPIYMLTAKTREQRRPKQHSTCETVVKRGSSTAKLNQDFCKMSRQLDLPIL